METLDNLKKTLDTSKSIKQVVSTMKALSSANIKKYEKVVKILYAYRSNIELALQAIVMYEESINVNDLEYIKGAKNDRNLIIAFGSNQGLCGRFNDRIMNFVVEDLNYMEQNKIVVIGERLNMLMEITNLNVAQSISIPNSIENVSNTVYEILQIIEDEISKNSSDRVFLYYTTNDETIHGTLTKTRLIPVDKKILENVKKKVWPTNNIPYWQVDTRTIISDLLKQYIFVAINNALVNSMSSEQRNRLITLQNAESNINDLIKTKNLEYNQKRQGTITSELLDVISGYLVAKRKKK